MKTNKTPKTKKVVNKSKDIYTLSFICFGQTFTSTGNTLEEALNNLKINNAKGRAIVRVQHADRTKERIIMPNVVARFANSVGMTKNIIIKNLSYLLQ